MGPPILGDLLSELKWDEVISQYLEPAHMLPQGSFDPETMAKIIQGELQAFLKKHGKLLLHWDCSARSLLSKTNQFIPETDQHHQWGTFVGQLRELRLASPNEVDEDERSELESEISVNILEDVELMLTDDV